MSTYCTLAMDTAFATITFTGRDTVLWTCAWPDVDEEGVFADCLFVDYFSPKINEMPHPRPVESRHSAEIILI